MEDEFLKNRKDLMRKEGESVEELFIKSATHSGYNCERSRFHQNYYEHIDVIINKDDITEYVDVKGIKKFYEHGYTWVELKTKNNLGWLYAEKLDSIVFERENTFDFVRLSELRELIESKLLQNIVYFEIQNNLEDMCYAQYLRWGDLIVLTPFKDIDKIIYKRIEKYDN